MEKTIGGDRITKIGFVTGHRTEALQGCHEFQYRKAYPDSEILFWDDVPPEDIDRFDCLVLRQDEKTLGGLPLLRNIYDGKIIMYWGFVSRGLLNFDIPTFLNIKKADALFSVYTHDTLEILKFYSGKPVHHMPIPIDPLAYPKRITTSLRKVIVGYHGASPFKALFHNLSVLKGLGECKAYVRGSFHPGFHARARDMLVDLGIKAELLPHQDWKQYIETTKDASLQLLLSDGEETGRMLPESAAMTIPAISTAKRNEGCSFYPDLEFSYPDIISAAEKGRKVLDNPKYARKLNEDAYARLYNICITNPNIVNNFKEKIELVMSC